MEELKNVNYLILQQSTISLWILQRKHNFFLFIQTNLDVRLAMAKITRGKQVWPNLDEPAKSGPAKSPMDIVLRIKATTTTVEILTESLGPGVTPLSLEKDGNSALSQNVPNYQEQVKPIHIIHIHGFLYPLISENCSVGEWTEWENCSKTCGGGDQKRNRRVTTPGTGGGKACSSLAESRKCNKTPCPPKGQVLLHLLYIDL